MFCFVFFTKQTFLEFITTNNFVSPEELIYSLLWYDEDSVIYSDFSLPLLPRSKALI